MRMMKKRTVKTNLNFARMDRLFLLIKMYVLIQQSVKRIRNLEVTYSLVADITEL